MRKHFWSAQRGKRRVLCSVGKGALFSLVRQVLDHHNRSSFASRWWIHLVRAFVLHTPAIPVVVATSERTRPTGTFVGERAQVEASFYPYRKQVAVLRTNRLVVYNLGCREGAFSLHSEAVRRSNEAGSVRRSGNGSVAGWQAPDTAQSA